MLQDYLYTKKTIPEVLEAYIGELSQSGETIDFHHANKLRSYKNLILDLKFLKELRDLFNDTYDLIDHAHPQLHFNISGRLKSLISTEKKIRYYQSIGKSLDLVNDLFAFRIIIFGNKEIDLVSHCYKVAEDLINFLAPKGFTPTEAPPLIEATKEDRPKNKFNKDFVYKDVIKDYICFPKKNGYQSIHIVFVNTEGKKFEIQIRTAEMHLHAEDGSADHYEYKNRIHGSIDIPFDAEKVSVYGYYNERIDFAGIDKSLSIFQRQKTF